MVVKVGILNVKEQNTLSGVIKWRGMCSCSQTWEDAGVFGTLKTETFSFMPRTTDHNPALTPQNEIVWSYTWGGRRNHG